MKKNLILLLWIWFGGCVVLFLITTKVFSDDSEIENLCKQIKDADMYATGGVGITGVKTDAMNAGEKIISSYKEKALPYLLEIYQNSDNPAAQLYAVKFISAIDIEKGKGLFEKFLNDNRTVQIAVGCVVYAKVVKDIARDELDEILQAKKSKIKDSRISRDVH